MVPDCTSSERERGGTRPGLSKAFSTQLGSGNPIRLINTLQYQTTAFVNQNKLAASANGTLYVEDTTTTMASVSSSLTLASDRAIQSANRVESLFIADDGATLCKGTDGVLSGTSFTSSSVGNFASAGVNDDDHMLVFTAHTAINEVQTITFSGTPTGGVWRVRYDGQTTDPLAYDITGANLQVALRALSSVNGANVTVSGNGPYVCTFSGTLAGIDVPLMTVDDSGLTGGTDPSIAVAETVIGSTSVEWAGSWQIASVATTTITLSKTLRDLTGITFYVQRAPKRYNAQTGTLSLWLTEDAADGYPKGFVPVGRPLCLLWRDRLVLAGGKYTPHLFEMSRQGNPYDFDYGAEPDDYGAAVAGTLSEAGQLGEPITAIIPHSNECLIFGCTSSLWILRGDPAYGGKIDNLSNEIGVLSATSFARTPEDYLYFLSRDGIFLMAPGCGSIPVSVSREAMPRELLNIDTTTHTVSMAYDVRYRVIHIFVTKNSDTSTTHWWIDTKLTMYGDATNFSPWKVVFGSTTCDPFFVHSRRDNASDYSVVMLGGRDGYIRRFAHNVATDDGTAFTSYVDYGPLRASSNDYSDGMVHDITGIVAADSGDVKCEFRAGETFEGAYNATALTPAIYWRTPGLQYPQTIRRACRAFCIRLSNGTSGEAWEMEGLNVTISDRGRQRKQ